MVASGMLRLYTTTIDPVLSAEALSVVGRRSTYWYEYGVIRVFSFSFSLYGVGIFFKYRGINVYCLKGNLIKKSYTDKEKHFSFIYVIFIWLCLYVSLAIRTHQG